MYSVFNQLGCLFATAKARKFSSINTKTLQNLKIRSIINLAGRYNYNSSKVITNYLKPLAKKEFTITDTLKFPELLKRQSLVILPVNKTTVYILKRI